MFNGYIIAFERLDNKPEQFKREESHYNIPNFLLNLFSIFNKKK